MINVALDTGIFRKNPKRDGLAFKTLEKLIEKREVRLFIPYVVMREFQTQQRSQYEGSIMAGIKAIKGLKNKQLTDKVSGLVVKLEKELDEAQEQILTNVESDFYEWANKYARIIPLCETQAIDALEAYFKGAPPVKTIKNRKDIPDSFIARSLELVLKEQKHLHVIIEDAELLKTFKDNPSCESHGDLDEFLSLDVIQNKLNEFEIVEKLREVLRSLKAFEEASREIETNIKHKIGDWVSGQSFKDDAIPDDNNEAYIESYSEPHTINIEFSEGSYYGDGIIGVPFYLEMAVLVSFYIYKPDYHCLDTVEIDSMHISAHNRHYYEAEKELNINVQGLVSIELDIKNINVDEVEESINFDSIDIDEINDISLVD